MHVLEKLIAYGALPITVSGEDHVRCCAQLIFPRSIHLLRMRKNK